MQIISSSGKPWEAGWGRFDSVTLRLSDDELRFMSGAIRETERVVEPSDILAKTGYSSQDFEELGKKLNAIYFNYFEVEDGGSPDCIDVTFISEEVRLIQSAIRVALSEIEGSEFEIILGAFRQEFEALGMELESLFGATNLENNK